ncbi:MAG TPA: glycosyltransferase [Firmicutes bacterium]|nr:glycosyltransferase [Bacillota bacterium]
MTRIAIVINDLIRFGGAERYLIEQFRFFHKLGFSIEIFTGEINLDLFKFGEIPSFIHHIDSKSKRLQGRINDFASEIGFWNPDLVIAHAQPANLIALRVNERFGTPYVLNIHGTFINFENDLNRYSSRFRVKALNYIRKNPGIQEFISLSTPKLCFKKRLQINYWARRDYLSFTKSTLIFVLTSEEQRLVREFYGCDSIVHHPGYFRNETSVSSEPDSDKKDFTLLFIGRLDKRKRLENIIKAVSLIPPASRPGLKIFLIGSGSERESLESLILRNDLKEIIKLTGNLTDTELTRLMKSCSGILYPAWVTYGLVVIEALALGLPVITAEDTGIVKELNQSGLHKNILTTDGSPESICSRILELKRSPFRNIIPESVLDRFSYDNAFKCMVHHLEKSFLREKQEDKINILMLPKFINPYQDIIITGLEDAGCIVGTNFNLLNRKNLKRVRDRIDILHLHWLDPFYLNVNSGIEAYIASRKFLVKIRSLKKSGVKIVWTVHNLINHNLKYLKIDRQVHRRLLRLADAVIVMSEYSRMRLQEEYGFEPSNLNIIPLPSYTGFYPNSISREEARKQLNLSENDKVILLFGLLKRYKGLLYLLDNGIIDRFPDIKWLFIGRVEPDNFKAELLKQFSGKNNVFPNLNYIPDNEVQYYFKASDISILPYTDFLTSSNLILSLSFGHPVICTDHGFFKEILSGTRNFFFKPDSPETLVTAITSAFNSDLSLLGRENLKLAESFGHALITAKTKEVYLKVLGER